MIVDSSALIAIVLHEPEAEQFQEKLIAAKTVSLSAVTMFEASMVAMSRKGDVGLSRLRQLLRLAEAIIVPFDGNQSGIALDAFRRYGKGNSPARLNFGDCAAYALAHSTGQPLLYKGDDFTHTDIAAA